MTRDAIDAALVYHERTKHHLPNRFAPSLGYLDWQDKPEPFRRYEGAERIALARVAAGDEPLLDGLYDPTGGAAHPRDEAGIAQLLYDSLALSAWKQAGPERWALRCNPSSGNLHPTEGYLIGADLPGICEAPTVFHYSPLHHALERRAELPGEGWRALGLPDESFLLALTSIHWREAWKYGERAYRYCQLDVGHALAAISYAAAAVGWHVRLLDGVDDDALERLLGVAGQQGPEAEHGDGLLLVSRRPVVTQDLASFELPEALLGASFSGAPNRLSDEPVDWPAINAVAAACRRGGSTGVPDSLPDGELPTRAEPSLRPVSARRVFRTRRSAVDMDGESTMAAADFFRVLARLMPGAGKVPFAALPGQPRVHPVLFVHHVEGLEPGLYLLERDGRSQQRLRAALRRDFAFEPVDTGTLDLPLTRLETGDARSVARTLCCHQDIASDGVFAVAMLAELEPALQEHGPWMYPRLFWEAGAMGQVLYLEAEAAGLRGTGIGCFFDDGVHELLGIKGTELQTVYGFTVGGPIDDPRLQTLDAYHHLMG